MKLYMCCITNLTEKSLSEPAVHSHIMGGMYILSTVVPSLSTWVCISHHKLFIPCFMGPVLIYGAGTTEKHGSCLAMLVIMIVMCDIVSLSMMTL